MDSSIIGAIATAPGSGAIAVIRVSGEGAIRMCDRIFTSPSGRPLSAARANTVHFGRVEEKGEVLDEVLVTLFHAPHSFTGEESVEISCHASPYIQQRILQLLVSLGARVAFPGEFTQRAFLNGKMDLSQAEAIADLIASSSAATHRMALNQMRGGFSSELRQLRAELLQITSLLELELDFSEEDVVFADRSELRSIVLKISDLLARLCRSFALGNVLKNGVPVAIVGNTNVGKSTLLNALLKEERAIVSDIAGTTRDVIEDTVTFEGITFRFIDTAGIRHTTDSIETMGIERTFVQVSRAHIVLLLVDATREDDTFSTYYHQVSAHLSPDAHLLILLNKIDQLTQPESLLERLHALAPQESVLPLSAKTGAHLNDLVARLTSTVNTAPLSANETIVSNVRHHEALTHAHAAITRALSAIDTGLSGEFISQDIRECLHYIGEITGEITTDEVLGHIFRHFCIGK